LFFKNSTFIYYVLNFINTEKIPVSTPVGVGVGVADGGGVLVWELDGVIDGV